MIETRDLTKTFDNFTAVDSLNLKIEKGEFFGLLGPNGAGKTTTISLLSTLLLPTKGEILIDGQQLTRQRPDLKRKISVITQEYSMRQDMNMDEIMEYQGRLYFMPRKQIKERTEELLFLHISAIPCILPVCLPFLPEAIWYPVHTLCSLPLF